MAAPFCTACGAAVADGTRFCVKCGQPLGQAAPPAMAQTTVWTPPVAPPPPAAPVTQAPTWTPPPPPPPPAMPSPMAQPVKEGAGAGLWIGIFGILLLIGGAGLWFYTTRMSGLHAGSTVQVAATGQSDPTAAQPTSSQPTPTPVSTLVAAPTPNPTTEVIPPNPDQAQKDSTPTPAPSQPSQTSGQPTGQTRPQPAQTRPAAAPPSNPAPAQPVRAARQTSGVLHASVEVAQNGEVVFENLPGARLKFTFDHSLWQPTISHQANGTQTLVMRSLKAGIQRTCDVTWEIVQ
jgi:hypothetical protein